MVTPTTFPSLPSSATALLISRRRTGTVWYCSDVADLSSVTCMAPLQGQFNPNLRDCPGASGAQAWTKYALLLSQTGQSAEAVVIYKKALPNVPDVNAQTIGRFPDPETLSPAAFQASTQIMPKP